MGSLFSDSCGQVLAGDALWVLQRSSFLQNLSKAGPHVMIMSTKRSASAKNNWIFMLKIACFAICISVICCKVNEEGERVVSMLCISDAPILLVIASKRSINFGLDCVIILSLPFVFWKWLTNPSACTVGHEVFS